MHQFSIRDLLVLTLVIAFLFLALALGEIAAGMAAVTTVLIFGAAGGHAGGAIEKRCQEKLRLSVEGAKNLGTEKGLHANS